MTDLRPFNIEIGDDALQDLKQRLANTRWPDAETPDDWSQGIRLQYMKEVAEYWHGSYDWRPCEAWLNQWDGYLTEIDGLDIHFLHIRSKVDSARPLLMTHGWPGSVLEFRHVIEPLIDPESHGGTAKDAFHLVLPTLPGFGFSAKPTRPGWGVRKVATAWNELMVRLGYDAYFAQGGDWGSIITTEIGAQNLGNCKAIHVTMVPPIPDPMDNLSELEQASLKAAAFYRDHDSGYQFQQRTRPQTLGYGLADSPVGQAAWILEKFYQWMDCSGHPENVVSRDELLDNVMMYWLTDTGASSARFYWESIGQASEPTPVPVTAGITSFPKDILFTSERWARNRYQDLVYFRAMDRGGHFASVELPDVFVSELRTHFGAL